MPAERRRPAGPAAPLHPLGLQIADVLLDAELARMRQERHEGRAPHPDGARPSLAGKDEAGDPNTGPSVRIHTSSRA